MVRNKKINPELRRKAEALWSGGGTLRCVLDGASGMKTGYHHTPIDGKDPYEDTEPHELLPVCPSCHRKLENCYDMPINHVAEWLCKKKVELTKKTLEEYMEERLNSLLSNYKVGLGNEDKAIDKEELKKVVDENLYRLIKEEEY